jgi:hypothetical protein
MAVDLAALIPFIFAQPAAAGSLLLNAVIGTALGPGFALLARRAGRSLQPDIIHA